MRNKKAKLRSQCDKLWYQIVIARNPFCEVCGEPTIYAHHFYFKSSCPALRYEIENGVGLCVKCHPKLHFRDPKMVEEQIIKKRGLKWLQKLQKLSKQEFISKWTVGYYQNILKVLQ